MIDPTTVAAYVAAYPHLRHLAAVLPDPRAEKQFRDAACRLAAPQTVTAQALAKMAWPELGRA